MQRSEMILEFKKFLNENRDSISEKIPDIKDLPPNDEWFLEDIWDEIYEKEVASNGKV